ncbi:MAG: hypothetical protein PHW01_04775 [Patescibacteria group bacterium]|nr:hypothetical protein [Patescibacteria group bacterium]
MEILDQVVTGVVTVKISNKGDQRRDWVILKEEPLIVVAEKVYKKFWPNQKKYSGFNVKSFDPLTNMLEVEVKY